MKKRFFILGILAIFTVSANAAMSYECSFEATKGGLLKGSYVKVSADSKAEAERKARAKIRKNRGSDVVIKYLRCK